ncbi:MAG TPA: outer membrane protein [Pseudolabrys sp.]|nr:outer membrane protein [Pseudolabrys sp.]
MRFVSSLALAGILSFGFIPSALAADLPVKAPPAPAIVAPTWTGFYVGANVGGGWGSRDVDFSPNDPATVTFFNPAAFDGAPPPGSFRSSGVLGGLQLGYNWQFNRTWLIGVETDFNWSGIKGSEAIAGARFGALPITATVDERIKWFGTARARLGYLPAENLLAYVTGGFAYGRVEHSGSYFNNSVGASVIAPGFNFSCNTGTTCFAGSSSDTATGWVLGGGLEYAIWKNLTLKAEYLYVSLGSQPVTETALNFNPRSAPASFSANFSRTNFNVARVGLNYRF